MSDDTELNTKGLDALLKALEKAPKARIGIMGDSVRSGGGQGLTNAEVGAIHEFGNGQTPQRSFLRMPLTVHLPKALERAGLFDRDVMARLLVTSSALPIVRKMAIIAEGVVLEAFATGGYGEWPPSDMSRKKVHQTLVETQQLRNSITSEVDENG